MPSIQSSKKKKKVSSLLLLLLINFKPLKLIFQFPPIFPVPQEFTRPISKHGGETTSDSRRLPRALSASRVKIKDLSLCQSFYMALSMLTVNSYTVKFSAERIVFYQEHCEIKTKRRNLYLFIFPLIIHRKS